MDDTGRFQPMIGANAVRFSGTELNNGVEALHDCAGQLLIGPKPVERQGSAIAQHASNLLHGLVFERIVLVRQLSGNCLA